MNIGLLGWGDLLDDAVLHDDDLVRDAHRLLLVVRDEDGCDARRLLDAADLLARLDAEPGVEVRQRLVEEEDLGLLRDGAGDGDTLLLAA